MTDLNELMLLPHDQLMSLVWLNVFLEQLGLPLPAWPTLLFVGAVGGAASLWPLLPGVLLASLIADSLWYYAALRHGPALIERLERWFPGSVAQIERARVGYQRQGPRLLLIAKLVPAGGALSTLMAGAVAMPLATFLLFDALGALIWAGSALLIGATLGSVAQLWQPEILLNYSWAAALLFVLPLGWVLYRHRRQPSLALADADDPR